MSVFAEGNKNVKRQNVSLSLLISVLRLLFFACFGCFAELVINNSDIVSFTLVLLPPVSPCVFKRKVELKITLFTILQGG